MANGLDAQVDSGKRLSRLAEVANGITRAIKEKRLTQRAAGRRTGPKVEREGRTRINVVSARH